MKTPVLTMIALLSLAAPVTAVSVIVVATPAIAGDHHGGGGFHSGGHHGGGGGWVAPFVGGAIVGGVLGGALAYPDAPGYAAPSPYYAPAPYQPYYRWDCDAYGRCGWVWR